MAKVQIKSEKNTPFGGIFHVGEHFSRYMARLSTKSRVSVYVVRRAGIVGGRVQILPWTPEFNASKVRVYIALKTANIKFSRSIMPFVKFSMGYPQQDSAEFARNNVEVPWKWRRREAIFHDFAPFLPLHYAYEGRFFSLTQRHLSCQTYRFLEDFLYKSPFRSEKALHHA